MPIEPARSPVFCRIRSLLATVLLLVIPEAAQVSMTRIAPVTLDELLLSSSHIVIAAPNSPPGVTEEIPVVEGGKTYAPYRRHVKRYRVAESLLGDLTPGATIEVVSADDASLEHRHRLYVIEGTSKSYYDRRYEPKARAEPGGPLILFLRQHANNKRYSFSAGQSVEGLAMKKEVENRLKTGKDADTHAAQVDQALRKHGDFGVYGDLRAGLASVRRHNTVTLTDVKEGVRVDIVPHGGHGHEYQFVVTANGAIENFMAGESEPAVVAVPQTLIFGFDNLRLRKQDGAITLTLVPVWRDAQVGPPPGFEQGTRTLRLTSEEFADLWRRLNEIDFARYARVTDADFETTPPDLRHGESLHYVVNGREMVQWLRSDQWLKAELRAPLLALYNELTPRVAAQPLDDPAGVAQLTLRDVQGLHGGQNVYVLHDRNVVVQRVTPTETGLHERRFEFVLSEAQWTALQQLLARHPPGKIRIPMRPGIPDQARPEITLVTRDGAVTTVAKWDDDRHADFDALYTQLLRLADHTKNRKPVWAGRYVHGWQPE